MCREIGILFALVKTNSSDNYLVFIEISNETCDKIIVILVIAKNLMCVCVFLDLINVKPRLSKFKTRYSYQNVIFKSQRSWVSCARVWLFTNYRKNALIRESLSGDVCMHIVSPQVTVSMLLKNASSIWIGFEAQEKTHSWQRRK